MNVNLKTTNTEDLSSVAKRVRYLIQLFELDSDYGLARKTGVSRNTIRGVITRDSIGPKTARALSRGLGISYKWLLLGEGPVDAPHAPGSAPDHEAHISGVDEYAYAYIRKAKSHLSAGGGVIPDEDFEEQRYAFIKSWLKTVATSEAACILMEIDGDSMRPTLESGDMVLVDQGRQELISDGIYAFGEGDVINIKRLQRVHPNIRIVSDNPDRDLYPSREVDPSVIRIIGRVIWFARQLR